jgi:LPXTG-motif cell wall-anchored protein
MKLRRAMAAAAATAVLAPLALLSAPAAFADGTEPGGTASVSPSGSPSESPSESASGTPGTGEPGPDDTPADPSTAPEDTPSAPAAQNAGPDRDDTGTDTTDTTDTSSPSDPTDPDVPYCEELDEDYGDAKVSASVKGLPGKVVAGSGFHPFRLVVTNDSDADLTGVAFYAEVENYELDEDKFLSPYVDLEFKNPEDGAWTRIGDDEWAGDYFFHTEELKSGASEKLDLRVRIDAKAPAGDAYSFGSGAYLDRVEDQDCVAEGWAQYDFEVLEAGSANPDPGEADPGDGDEKEPEPVEKPQGGSSELPAGNLAATGSSSALPVIGLVGGIAVVVGGGAVFAARRRRDGDGDASR